VKHACTIADSVIAISEQTKQDLIEFLKIPEDKITILYQAIHPRYYKREPKTSEGLELRSIPQQETLTPSQKSYFLFVGAFEERKNVRRLLTAYRVLAKEINEDLYLVGKGPQEKELREMSRSFGIEKRVHFFSSLKSEDLPALYQGASALVYPSIFEGFGLPLVEALMSETQVITSRGSCFPEAAGPSAFYVDPLRTDEIAGAMKMVSYMPPNERQRRIEIGYQHGQQFHWKRTANEMLKHYQMLVEKKERHK
jgi:glycosyltransferase involved in cell wall biosynthesis